MRTPRTPEEGVFVGSKLGHLHFRPDCPIDFLSIAYQLTSCIRHFHSPTRTELAGPLPPCGHPSLPVATRCTEYSSRNNRLMALPHKVSVGIQTPLSQPSNCHYCHNHFTLRSDGIFSDPSFFFFFFFWQGSWPGDSDMPHFVTILGCLQLRGFASLCASDLLTASPVSSSPVQSQIPKAGSDLSLPLSHPSTSSSRLAPPENSSQGKKKRKENARQLSALTTSPT